MKAPYHALIPRVSDHIRKILKRLRLKPDQAPDIFIKRHKGNKHRYNCVCTDATGDRVVFYARLHNNGDAKEKFVSDVEHLRAFSRRSSMLSRRTSRIYKSSLTKSGEWYVREYLDAKAIGSEYQTNSALPLSAVREFSDLFRALQHIPDVTMPEQRGGDFFLQIAEGNIRATKSLFSIPERKRLRKFLHRSYAPIEEHARFRVHGDAHAGNILFDGKRSSIIDWETVHINLRTTDIAYFYAGLRHHPRFRENLIRTFRARISWKKQFELLFPKSVMFFALNHLFMLIKNKPGVLSAQERRDAVRYAKRLSLAAITGYDKLKKF